MIPTSPPPRHIKMGWDYEMEHFETVLVFVNESRGKEKVFEILSYLASHELQSRRFFLFYDLTGTKFSLFKRQRNYEGKK